MKQFKQTFQTWLLSHVSDCAAALGIMPGQCVTAKTFDFAKYKLKDNALDMLTFEYDSYTASFPVCRVFNVLFQLGYKKEIVVKQTIDNVTTNNVVADVDMQLPDLTKVKSCFCDWSETYNCIHIDLLHGAIVASNRQVIKYYHAPLLSTHKQDYRFGTIDKKDIQALSNQRVRVIVDEVVTNNYITYIITEDGTLYAHGYVGRPFDYNYVFRHIAYNPDDAVILDKSGYKQLLVVKPAPKANHVDKMVIVKYQDGEITAEYNDTNLIETTKRTITAANNPDVHYNGNIEINNLVSLKEFQADKLYFADDCYLLATNKDGIFVSAVHGCRCDTKATNNAIELIETVSGDEIIKVAEVITTFTEVAEIAIKRAQLTNKANELRQLAKEAGVSLTDLFPELTQAKQEQEPIPSVNCTNDANLSQNDKRAKARVRRWHRHRSLQRIGQTKRRVVKACSSRISHFVVKNAVIAPIVKTAPRPPTIKYHIIRQPTTGKPDYYMQTTKKRLK
jgi:hypothetical protein